MRRLAIILVSLSMFAGGFACQAVEDEVRQRAQEELDRQQKRVEKRVDEEINERSTQIEERVEEEITRQLER